MCTSKPRAPSPSPLPPPPPPPAEINPQAPVIDPRSKDKLLGRARRGVGLDAFKIPSRTTTGPLAGLNV